MANGTGAGGDFAPSPGAHGGGVNETNPAPHGGSNYNGDGSGQWADYGMTTYGKRLPPQSTFPKLDVSGSPDSVSCNPDKLTQVAKAMQDELDALNGPKGAPSQLRGIRVDIIPPGYQQNDWPTAAAFSANANNATTGVMKFYDDLSKAYDTVISNLHATVSNYTNADQATQQAANNAAA